MSRGYWLLLSADLVSSLGNWLYLVTLPLLVLHLTGSAMRTGAVYAIAYLPYLLFSLPGGILADRLERRRVLIAGDLTAGMIACLLGIMVAAGTRSLWLIYLVAFLLASVDPLYHPAFQSIVPELVAPKALATANARLNGGESLTSVAGPALAGALVAFGGYQTTVFIDSASFFASASLLALIGRRAVRPRIASKASIRSELKESLHHVRGNTILLAGALTFTAFNLFTWMIEANFVFYLTVYRHFGPSLVGLMLGLQGVGAVIGSLVAGRVLAVAGNRPGLMITAVNAGMGLLFVVLIPARGPLWIGLVWMLIFGLGAGANVAWFTLRQQIVPSAILGRVVAMTRMICFLSIPVSALLAGAIESRLHNLPLLMAIVGVCNLATAIAASFTPLRRDLHHRDASPHHAPSH